MSDYTIDTIATADAGDLPSSRWLPAAEAAAMYLLVLVYIWWGEARAEALVLIPLAAVIASHLYRRETPAALGFRLTNFGRCAREVGPALLALTLALVALTTALGTAHSATPRRVLAVLALYCLWGLFQQYVLNAYFVSRFAMAVRSPHVAAMLGAICFAGAHTPNWFLMAVTLVAGYLSARIYLAYRNLLFLGVAHAVLGTFIVFAVPRSITHGLVTGPAELHAARVATHCRATPSEHVRR